MRKIDGYKTSILDRARKFAVQVLLISSQLPKNPAGFTIADQLVRAATSIGANLIEAQEAVSSRDFLYKISISLKEAKETLYWLELIEGSKLLPKDVLSTLIQECNEIVRMLVTTSRKLKEKQS
jgi:four helix bundle protein